MKIKSLKIKLIALLAIPVIAFCACGPVSQSVFAAEGLEQGAKAAQGDDTPPCLFTSNTTDKSDPCYKKTGIFTVIANTMLFIIGAVAVIMLIYGGIRYTISGGDQASVTAAKNTIIYGVVGLIVAIMAYAIVNWVIGLF